MNKKEIFEKAVEYAAEQSTSQEAALGAMRLAKRIIGVKEMLAFAGECCEDPKWIAVVNKVSPALNNEKMRGCTR